MNEIMQPNEGSVVGLPQKREKTIEILNNCFSSDLIEMDELEKRLELAENAKSIEVLDELIKDVPTHMLNPEEISPVPATGKERKFSHSIIMGSKKITPSKLTNNTKIKIIMGDCIMDFRMVNLPPGVTEIRVKIIMASCEIIVPPGVIVENETKEIMCDVKEDSLLGRINKSADKILRITGKVIMSSLNINVR